MTYADPKLHALHLLLAIAWVDGRLAPAERQLIESIVVTMPADAVQHLVPWLETPPPEPDWSQLHDPVLAHDLLTSAMRLVLIDRVVTPCEQDALERLRQALHVDSNDFSQLQRMVERELTRSGQIG